MYNGSRLIEAVDGRDDDTAALEISSVDIKLNETQRPTAYTVRLLSQPRSSVNVTVRSTRLAVSESSRNPSSVSCDTTTDAQDVCFQHIQQLRSSVHDNPTWYPCLTAESSLEELQFYLYSVPGSQCPVPCRIDTNRACAADPQSSWAGALDVSPLALHFSVRNWNQPQEILVQARGDSVDLGDEYSFKLSHITSSHDEAYQGISGVVVVTVRDDDDAGVSLSANSSAAVEGGTKVDGRRNR